MARTLIKVTNEPTDNLAYNADMNLWQRGTTSLQRGTCTADRWKNQMFFAGFGDTQSTRQADSPSVLSKHCLEVKHITASTGNVLGYSVQQTWEARDVRRFIGRTVSFGFWYKSNLVGIHTARVFGTAAGLTPTSASTSTLGASVSIADDGGYPCVFIAFPVNAANTWEFKTVTVTFSSTAPTAAENAAALTFGVGFKVSTNFAFGYTALAVNDYFRLAQVMVNVGFQVAPFRTRGVSPADELALCQRYYEKSAPVESLPNSTAGLIAPSVGEMNSATSGGGASRAWFLVTKRATPTVTAWDRVLNPDQVTIKQVGVSESHQVASILASEAGFDIRGTSRPGGSAMGNHIFAFAADAEF